jgi:hypothetical protein
LLCLTFWRIAERGKMNKAVVSVCFLLSFSGAVFAQDCKALKDRIKEKIESANYCNTDGDCVIQDFGCPFGCGSYVNKNFNTNGIKKEITAFQSCPESRCRYKCMFPPQPVCINSKCRIPLCEQGKQYKYMDCQCPEGTALALVYNESEKGWFNVCDKNNKPASKEQK